MNIWIPTFGVKKKKDSNNCIIEEKISCSMNHPVLQNRLKLLKINIFMLRVYKPYISLRGCIWDIGYNIRVHLIDAGPSLEEGIGRAGEVSCDRSFYCRNCKFVCSTYVYHSK